MIPAIIKRVQAEDVRLHHEIQRGDQWCEVRKIERMISPNGDQLVYISYVRELEHGIKITRRGRFLAYSPVTVRYEA